MRWSHVHTCAAIGFMARLYPAEGELYREEEMKKIFILQCNNTGITRWHLQSSLGASNLFAWETITKTVMPSLS